jgi:hypothetical protein
VFAVLKAISQWAKISNVKTPKLLPS